VSHRAQFWVLSFSRVTYPQSVSLQTHLALAYSSMLRYTIICIAVSDRYARTTVITFRLTSALHSWFCHNGLALNSTKSESILIGTRERLRTLPAIASPIIAGWHSRPIFRRHQNAWRHIVPKLDLKQACFLAIPQYSFLHPCAPSY